MTPIFDVLMVVWVFNMVDIVIRVSVDFEMSIGVCSIMSEVGDKMIDVNCSFISSEDKDEVSI